MRDRLRRACAPAFFASLLYSSLAYAQGIPLGVGDASAPPARTFRLNAATLWTRYDSRFTSSGVEPLGAPFTADSLGVRQIPSLAPAESLVRAASDIPFSLTMGRSRLDATAREEVIPLSLEYGVTNRFSVGVMVPFVRKRSAMQFRLDTAGGFNANVGPNAHRTSTAAELNNVFLQAQFANAAQTLSARLTTCQTNPGAPGCAALVGREAEAQALIIASQAFALELEALYGSDDSEGQAFVPTDASDAQAAIVARIAAFNVQYRDLLASTTDLLTASPSAAGGPPGVADLRAYFAAEGRDSIATQERVGIGDVEVGFRARLLHRKPTQEQPLGIQLTVASAVRLGTASDESSSGIIDMRLGEAIERIDSRVLLDVGYARFGLFAAGRFDATLGTSEPDSADAFPVPASQVSRSIIEVHVAPRYHFSGPFAVHGAYSFRSFSEAGHDQMVGGGVSFTNLDRTPANKHPPIEMRFTHLQSINGSAGRPNFFRDQLEVRIYYRLGRR